MEATGRLIRLIRKYQARGAGHLRPVRRIRASGPHPGTPDRCGRLLGLQRSGPFPARGRRRGHGSRTSCTGRPGPRAESGRWPTHGWPKAPSPKTTPTECDRAARPDETITTWIDVREYFGLKEDAWRAHRTQIPDDWFFFLVPEEIRPELFGRETFVRVFSDVETPAREDDLFAGLR